MFKLIVHNSKLHSVDFATNAILEANKALMYQEGLSLATKIHLNGKATILKGTREQCRAAARIIKAKGGDKVAASLFRDNPEFKNLNWDAPMRTSIKTSFLSKK